MKARCVSVKKNSSYSNSYYFYYWFSGGDSPEVVGVWQALTSRSQAGFPNFKGARFFLWFLRKGVRDMDEESLFWRSIPEEQVMDTPLSGFRYSPFLPENKPGPFQRKEEVKSISIPRWWKYWKQIQKKNIREVYRNGTDQRWKTEGRKKERNRSKGTLFPQYPPISSLSSIGKGEKSSLPPIYGDIVEAFPSVKYLKFQVFDNIPDFSLYIRQREFTIMAFISKAVDLHFKSR